MFKGLVNSLSKMDYIVAVESGNYVVRKKDTERDYISFAVGEKNKDNILAKFYSNLLSIKQAYN